MRVYVCKDRRGQSVEIHIAFTSQGRWAVCDIGEHTQFLCAVVIKGPGSVGYCTFSIGVLIRE
jgi:hypothetical protein